MNIITECSPDTVTAFPGRIYSKCLLLLLQVVEVDRIVIIILERKILFSVFVFIDRIDIEIVFRVRIDRERQCFICLL